MTYLQVQPGKGLPILHDGFRHLRQLRDFPGRQQGERQLLQIAAEHLMRRIFLHEDILEYSGIQERQDQRHRIGRQFRNQNIRTVQNPAAPVVIGENQTAGNKTVDQFLRRGIELLG